MNEHQASRTLLKSPPELWAECSDAQSLARHLGESVGEIQITRLEPESTVAWEGDRTSGTVKLEPSGWGTRVTLTCSTAFREELAPELEPEPDRPSQSDWPPDRNRPPEPDRPSHPNRPPEREPEPLSSGREANSASVAEQPPSPPAGGGLFTRVMRFLAARRAVAEPVGPAAAAQPPAAEPVAPEPQPPAAAERPAPAEGPPPAAEPAPPEERAAAESAEAGPPEPTESANVLAAALDSLGQAHHRPFSRA